MDDLPVLPKKEREVLSFLGNAIAGTRGRMVLNYLAKRLFRDEAAGQSVCWFDEETGLVDRIVYGRTRCPFVLVHEFGHAYHCYFFSAQTQRIAQGCETGSVVSLEPLEAVAIAFEQRLSGMINRFLYDPPPGLPSLATLGASWKKRSKQIAAQDTLDILAEIGHTGDEPIYELVERIMERGRPEA